MLRGKKPTSSGSVSRVKTKIVKLKQQSVKLTSNKHAKRVKHAVKLVHHHVAVKPHNHLMGRWVWYERWHTWKWHKFINLLILIAGLLSMSGITYQAFASGNDTKIWTFNTPGDYSFNSSKVESNSNNLRLKLSEVVQNFTVAGGQLQSNNVLDVTANSTHYFVVTDLGIDVIRQDNWTRDAYITSGGGFTTVDLANDYLYAGKNGGIYRWQISTLTNNTAVGSPRYSTSTSPALGSQNIKRISINIIASKVYIAVASFTYAELIKDDQGTNTIVKVPMLSSYYCNGVAISNDGALYYDMRNSSTSASTAVFAKHSAINAVADWTYNTNSVDFGADLAPLHGPNPGSGFTTGIRVSSGTSTANSGDNTLYIETEVGLSIIQENRTTPSSGTVNNYTSSSRGSNLISGSTAQGRFNTSSAAAQSIDNNANSYYQGLNFNAEDWLEYDLGSSKTFNFLKHYFWNTAVYTPSSYVVESSTQGTSTNLATSATAWAPWQTSSSYLPSYAIDNTYTSSYYTGFTTASSFPTMFEQSFASNQSITGVDLQFHNQATSAKNYTIQGSTTATVSLTPTTATASSTNSTNVATNSYDRSVSTRWNANVATNTSAQWLQLDYGTSRTFAGVAWADNATVVDYSIDYSDDGTNWTTAYSATNNTAAGNRIKFTSPVTGRYLRLYVTRSANPSSTTNVLVYEMEAFSSMFESGTMTTLDTVTNNSEQAKFSNFSSTSVKAVRVLVTTTYTVNSSFGLKEMKTYQNTFNGGTVTQLGSFTNLNLPVVWANYLSHDFAMNSTTSRYLRVRYTGYANTNMIVSELELNNTSLSDYAPSKIIASGLDTTNNKYYSVHNTSAPEDGKILRIDGVNVNTPSIGRVFNQANLSGLASNEFSSVKYVDSTKLLAGTASGASFIGDRYATDLPTIEPNDAYEPVAVASWKNFTESATKNSGEIYYQISNNNGANWYYWNGTAWVEAVGAQYNTATTIDTNINEFPTGTRQFKWKAFLSSNGSQAITLTNVTLVINPDISPPADNASNIQMFTEDGGTAISDASWTKADEPYFSWTGGNDDSNPGASGIKGYCLYLGTDEFANPTTTKGMLGTSPLDTEGECAFAVSSNSLDLSLSNLLGTPLSTSNDLYYLHIKAIDNSNNVYSGSSESFTFKFDNTAPTAPGYISGPSQFIATRDVTLTWPSSGAGSISDAHSGVVGLQYRINTGLWYGDNHNGAEDGTDLLGNTGSYTTDAFYDYPDLIEGNNIIYFRTLDNAGNYSSTYATAVIKINTASPSSPTNVVASPSTNTTNSFAFSWDSPASFVGLANTLKYCYTINTLPTVNTCTFAPTGQEYLDASAYATQPGSNTFYVVAEDEAGNINYDTYASTTFTANTAAPGIPLDMEIADISTKATSNWRVAVSWSVPSDQGAGVTSYRIYRSTDNSTFTQVASTAGVSYVDSGLSQQIYYYRVRACDSANNCGANSAVVEMLPTGKFTEPAELVSPPEISNVTTKRAKISWATNRVSDSKIAIGKEPGQYSPSEISNSEQVTTHNVSLDNLDAGTTYYFVARWTDEDGNTGVSDEGSFQTAPAPVLKEVNTLTVGLTAATVQFTTKDANVVDINFGKSDSFGGIKTINTSASESTYAVELNGLDDGVKYYYKLTMYDSEGGKYQSSIFSFSTLPRPRITQLQFQPVQGEPTSTQKVSWVTNVPTTSQLSYSRDGTPPIEVSDSKLITNHEMTIKDLADSSEYSLIALSRDGSGNLATSERQSFKTALDTRPPKISDVVVEKTVRGTGSEARGQIVVTWKTDEPATSQVRYAEGASSTQLNNQTIEDGNLTTEHVSIISDLSPSKAYNVQPASRDKSRNQGKGGVQSVIITRATDSVISIIFNTLQKMFGFN